MVDTIQPARGLAAASYAAARQSALRQSSAREPRAWNNAVAFEAQFLKTMLEQAYAGLSGEGPLGGAGVGSEAWRSFLIDEQAKAMTARGGIGLAAQIYRDTMQAKGAGHD